MKVFDKLLGVSQMKDSSLESFKNISAKTFSYKFHKIFIILFLISA